MIAYVILAALGVAVVGVIAKVGIDLRRDLREDRARHGGRLTVDAFYRALAIVALVVILVLVLIIWPWLAGALDEGS